MMCRSVQPTPSTFSQDVDRVEADLDEVVDPSPFTVVETERKPLMSE
jgi:hypothetical protein